MKNKPVFSIRNLLFSYQPGEAKSKDTGSAAGSAAKSGEFDVKIDALDIRRGEFIAFVGGNGAGKTTLLKLLNGLLEPSSGSILFREQPLGTSPEARIASRAVMVHQQPYLFTGSVASNVGYGLKIRKKSHNAIRRAVSEKLALVGLQGFTERRAQALSGGEQQRVALARALAVEPDVLLLDEPTAHMDPGSIRQLEKVLKELHRQKTTLIMSSHQMEFAYRLAERLEVMEEGRLMPNELNILKGEVARRDESFMYFKTYDGEIRCPSREGDFTTAVLPADDVILSLEPIETSAQNQFRGRVVSVVRRGSLVEVELDCGFPLKALITEYSREHLNVEPRRVLIATFKASAVRLY